MNNINIGFITCNSEKLKYYFPTKAEPDIVPSELPFTPDDQFAVNALRNKGAKVQAITWGCDIKKLKQFDIVIMRSPWDYMDTIENRNTFLEWLEKIEKADIKLENKPDFITWLIDKHYMGDLKDHNIPVTPTVFAEKGNSIKLNSYFTDWGPLILKPCISAAGEGLFFVKDSNQIKDFQNKINQQLESRSYMIQPFIPEIRYNGEWSLIFIDGKYSHSVHKAPARGDIFVHAELGGSLAFIEPAENIIKFAQQALPEINNAYNQKFNDTYNPLYLRLDIIETKDGPVISECEGVEPELFFRAKANSEYFFSESVINRTKNSNPKS